MDGGGSATGSAALRRSSAQFEGWNRVERSLPYRSEGFKDRGFGPPALRQASSVLAGVVNGLAKRPLRFAFKQAHRFW